MIGGYEHPTVSLAKSLVNPLIIFFSLIIAVAAEHEKFSGLHFLLGIFAFLVVTQVFDGFNFFETPYPHSAGFIAHGRNLLIAWAIVLGILGAVGYFSGMIGNFNPNVLLVWSILTPIALFIGQSLVRGYLEILRNRGSIRRSVIVGANDLGHKLACRIHQQRSRMTKVEAFFDDRMGDRCDPKLKFVVSGGIADVANYVAKFEIDLVYISLPMINHPRMIDLVNSLRDTTVSIYFVPDVFMFDLVLTRLDNINGMPVISVFETPLTGINAVHKRALDVLMAGLMLITLSPVMIAIALLVMATSSGPVIFKQLRYGIDGEEILVYKFRSMAVCENGAVVTQATQHDARVTRVGAVLRKTSLDELPQLLNVLQGTMSMVGPRPHAVAHNEHYRKLIRGYMWRHKVKPGITGWAQINGYRGETDTIDKMEGRVVYDIAYLKSWSLWLDIVIIFKTLKVVFKDTQAY